MSTKVDPRNPDYSLELNYEPWQFYEVGVWATDEGFYLSTDSGCSCPIPFESHSQESLTGPLTYEQAAEEITSLWNAAEDEWTTRPTDVLPDFLERIRRG